MKLDDRQANALRHLLGLEAGGKIPDEIKDRVHSIQERMRGLGKVKLDIQHLAILVEFQQRPDNTGGTIKAGANVLVEEDGELKEGTLVRYPHGKHTGSVHVRMRGQEIGKYRRFPEGVVRIAEEALV